MWLYFSLNFAVFCGIIEVDDFMEVAIWKIKYLQ